eukprot:COSAG06_NODE_24386_length_664_cov_1.184071_2_plen_112_part_01
MALAAGGYVLGFASLRQQRRRQSQGGSQEVKAAGEPSTGVQWPGCARSPAAAPAVMPRSASFRVAPKPGSPVVEEDMKTRLINGHARNDVESVIASRGGGEEGVDEEYLVQW